MYRAVYLTLLLGLALSPLVRGADLAPKPAAAPTLDQLIEQLGNKDFRVREKASKAIRAQGTAVLPALHKARSNPDAQIQLQLDLLIPPLERAAALTPKYVTLHMDKKPLKDVLAELKKQSGYTIVTAEAANGPQAKATYSFHLDKVLFWEALDKVCDASGMILRENGASETLTLMFQDSYVPYRCYDGTFRLWATNFGYNRGKNFGQLPRNGGLPNQLTYESLYLNFNIMNEPRLPILKLGQIKLLEAEDDEKVSLMPNGPNWYYNQWWWNPYYGGNNKTFFQSTNAYLMTPSRTAKTVKYVKGILPVTLLSEQRPTVVTSNLKADKGKKITLQRNRVTFSIEDVTTMANKQSTVRVGYSDEGGENPWDYGRIQSIQQRLELQDEKGNKIPCYVNMMNWMNANSGQFQIVTQPNNNTKVGPPAKLVFIEWIMMEHEVTFEFRGLPLP
jgi:hypothetical protein